MGSAVGLLLFLPLWSAVLEGAVSAQSSVTVTQLGKRDRNQVQTEDRAAHCWYRFILSYPPHLVRDYLQKLALTADHRVLDPFCGTGTTVVECQKQGIPSVGTEANPMAYFASSVKTDWSPAPDTLLTLADQIAAASQHDLATHQGPLKTLPDAAQKVILKGSISPRPLHKTLLLLHHIRTQAPLTQAPHLKLALAKAVIDHISNLRFGPEVGIKKPKDDAPVFDLWQQQVEQIAQDLVQLQRAPLGRPPAARIYQADARQIHTVLPPQSIDAVITSPPYPNEKDYTRTTRLESVLLGFIQTKQQLRILKQDLLRSNSRNVYTADQDDRWVDRHTGIQTIAKEIETRRQDLGKTSGFTRLYPRAVTLYFGGIARHLAELRHILRPGAQLAYVVGDQKSYLQVMIRTGQILGEIAQGLGYELVDIDLFRTRLASATQEPMNEEVVLLRWSGQWPDYAYPYADMPR
ncbi:MAG: DNA methyltransferase [Cyanobacteria bacterium J06632_22]